MFEWPWTALLVPLLLGVAPACSDAADSSAADVKTGLPEDAKLSSFDDDDAMAACQALNDGASQLISDAELVRAQCSSRAISAAAVLSDDKTSVTLDLAKCAELTKSCQSDPVSYGVMAKSGRNEADCSDAKANDQVKHCEASVAEYEACISKLLDQAKQTLANISCDNGRALLESDGAATKLDPQSVSACKTFLALCPDVQVAISVGD